MMNVINYMTDETGIMELRSREFKLRLLNRELISQKSQHLKWKLINTLLTAAAGPCIGPVDPAGQETEICTS